MTANRDDFRADLDRMLKRLLDVLGASLLLVALFPLIAVIAIAIKLDSRGPVFYRCRRIGLGGQELGMLKFRKMHGDAAGLPLTVREDPRLTPSGRILAKTKLDELPQLWNVLKGEMSLVGPRPEDPRFVEVRASDYALILSVRPGITGLSQLAFAKESEILDPLRRIDDYYERFLPQKIAIDRLYASRRNMWGDLNILAWTATAVFLRKDVAVNRKTGELTLRKRPAIRELAAARSTADDDEPHHRRPATVLRDLLRMLGLPRGAPSPMVFD
jgi:lipopolysaccharide/colanic/teichoic acid biosynthesis glycosyltransferase